VSFSASVVNTMLMNVFFVRSLPTLPPMLIPHTCVGMLWRSSFSVTSGYVYWSQSYDRKLQRKCCKFLQRLARFENKKIYFFFFENRSSLLNCWRCSCKFKSRRIGSWFLFCDISAPAFLCSHVV
jgi:hypothetical protein